MDLDALYARTREDFDDAVAALWRDAAATDPAGLAAWLRTVPFEDCHLFDVYEALATASPPEHTLLRGEFERLLDCTALLPDDERIPREMAAFAFVDDQGEESAWYAARLAPLLDEPEPRRRRLGASMLSDFLAGSERAVLARLAAMVRDDPDTAVRFAAWWALRDVQAEYPAIAVPPLRLPDRVRAALGLAPRR